MVLFDSRERFLRSVLRRLARQRVVSMLQPGNVPLVEKSIVMDDDVAAALLTCHMRGWVEPMTEEPIPHGSADRAIERLQAGQSPFDKSYVLYRLTDSGWQVIHDNHAWVVATFIIAVVTLLATVLGFQIKSS